ncbi:MAG: MOSC domain-containing protein [Candidatus Velthaea sp.]
MISVNTGAVRRVESGARSFTTGIFKEPRSGRVTVAGVNLHGDEQADLDAHGGPDRALYAYAGEDYDWWSGELGRELPPGTFGENLTLRGIAVNEALIGERWRIGNATLRLTSPRVPCFKLAAKMGDPRFVKRFGEALRPGPYLAIVEPGEIGAGDPVTIVHRPAHHITIREMTRIYMFERHRLAELLQADDLSESWRDWVKEHA